MNMTKFAVKLQILRQMPDDVFDELVKEFGLPTDGVKL